MYRQVQIGMSRAEVRSLLGAPNFDQSSAHDVAWYLPPPTPGAIAVWFDAHGRVAAKYLNPSLFNDN